MKSLIGFCGLKGSGKTTAAEVLCRRGYTRIRFAEPLKSMCIAMGIPRAHIDGDRKEEPLPMLGGRSARFAMQTLGTEWGRQIMHPELWVKLWENAVDHSPNYSQLVVDDVRFENEGRAIIDRGGRLVLLDRTLDRNEDLPHLAYNPEHGSEDLRWLFSGDFPNHTHFIENNSTLEVLEGKVLSLIRPLSHEPIAE